MGHTRELSKRVLDLVSQLPEQQRLAFILVAMDGCGYQATAEILDCSASSVRTHMQLAREKLRKARLSYG